MRYFELDKTGDATDTTELVVSLMDRSIVNMDLPDNTGQIFTLASCDGYSGTPYRFVTNYVVSREKYVLE